MKNMNGEEKLIKIEIAKVNCYPLKTHEQTALLSTGKPDSPPEDPIAGTD